MPNIRDRKLFILLTLFTLLGGSCSQSGKQDTISTPLKNNEDESRPTNTQNLVEQVEIELLESFPVQVNVIVQGKLSNSCEKINPIMDEQEGQLFTVEMTTVNQTLSNCQEINTPFRQVIPLAVDGLKAGTYTVKVNGITETFELVVDNIVRWE